MEEQRWLKTLRNCQSLLQVSEFAATCQRCPLRKGCRQVVVSAGVTSAKLMLIGEGPGADEDAQGLPFVGKAGQLLDNILHAGGFSRQNNVYITNVVKCRPPGNRIPTEEERQACLPILRQQYRLLQPKIVLLLGATAVQTVIDPQARITKVRGQWVEKDGVWFMPTYHPAALLRNEMLKKDVWDDMKQVIQRYREVVDAYHFPERKI